MNKLDNSFSVSLTGFNAADKQVELSATHRVVGHGLQRR